MTDASPPQWLGPWLTVDFIELSGTLPAESVPPSFVTAYFADLEAVLRGPAASLTVFPQADGGVVLDMAQEQAIVGWLALAVPDRFWVCGNASARSVIWIEQALISELHSARAAPRKGQHKANAQRQTITAILGALGVTKQRISSALGEFLQLNPAPNTAAPRVLCHYGDSLIVDMAPHLRVLGWFALHRSASFSVLKGLGLVKLHPSLLGEFASAAEPPAQEAEPLQAEPPPAAPPQAQPPPAEPPAQAAELPSAEDAEALGELEFEWPSTAWPQLGQLLAIADNLRQSVPPQLQSLQLAKLEQLLMPFTLEPSQVLALALLDLALRRQRVERLNAAALVKPAAVNTFFRAYAELLQLWRLAALQPNAARIGALSNALCVGGLLLLRERVLASLQQELVQLLGQQRRKLETYTALCLRQLGTLAPVAAPVELPQKKKPVK